MSIDLISGGTATEFPSVLVAPTGFTIDSVTSSGMSVSWTAPSQQGPALGYRVLNDADDSVVATKSWGTTSALIGNLTSETPYTFKVVTYDASGNSSDSNTDTDTTLAPSAFQLDLGHYVSTATTGMLPVITYPRPESESASTAYCKNAYPAMHWEIPIVVQGGSWPFKYVLMNSSFTAEGTAGFDYPSDMVIGETLTITGVDNVHEDTNDDHGVLSWPNPTGTSQTVYIRAIDQDGNEADVTLPITIGTAGWIFVDIVSGNDSTGDGTIGAPLKTFTDGAGAGLWGSGNSDNTYVGNRAVFMAGTYDIQDGSGENAVVAVTTKPLTYIPYHNGSTFESVVFNMSTGNITCTPADDLFMGHINLDGHKITAMNWRSIFIGGVQDRLTFYRLTFSDMIIGGTSWNTGVYYEAGTWINEGTVSYKCETAHTAAVFADDLLLEVWGGADWLTGIIYQAGDFRRVAGTGYLCQTNHTSNDWTTDKDTNGYWVQTGIKIGNDNPGCIMAYGISPSSNRRKYISVIRCISKADVEIQMYSGFNTNYIVAELNVFEQTLLSRPQHNAAGLIYFKDDSSYCSMRRNTALNITDGALHSFLFGLGDQGENITQRECCWNVGIIPTSDVTTQPVFETRLSPNIDCTDDFVFRNTFIHKTGIAMRILPSADATNLINNVAYGGNATITGAVGTYTDVDNLTVNPTTDIDSTGKLIGTSRATYLGLRGHEVA